MKRAADDASEIWRAHKLGQKQKREAARAADPDALRTAGLAFVAKNGGAHLVVDGRADFWPGTGRWIARTTPDKGRGVRSLVQHLKATR